MPGRFAMALIGMAVCSAAQQHAPPRQPQSAVRVSAESPFPADCDASQPGHHFRNSAVEPWVAVDPKDPLHLIGVWQQDRWSNGGSSGLLAECVAGRRPHLAAECSGIFGVFGWKQPVRARFRSMGDVFAGWDGLLYRPVAGGIEQRRCGLGRPVNRWRIPLGGAGHVDARPRAAIFSTTRSRSRRIRWIPSTCTQSGTGWWG